MYFFAGFLVVLARYYNSTIITLATFKLHFNNLLFFFSRRIYLNNSPNRSVLCATLTLPTKINPKFQLIYKAIALATSSSKIFTTVVHHLFISFPKNIYILFIVLYIVISIKFYKRVCKVYLYIALKYIKSFYIATIEYF